MKTIKIKTLVTGIAAGILLFTGCTKDGATGPAGAAGSANVSTHNISLTPSNWGADGYGGWYTLITTTGYDLTKGAVSTFMSNDNINWLALPAVGFTIGAPDINYQFNATSIEIFYDAQTGVASIAQPATTLYVKIVLIPPAMKKPSINYNNYAAVKAAYNL
jgi:hypothetical protein